MKRIFALLTAAAVLFTGCMQSVRLSRRAVVQALGIDYSDGEYTATMQLYGLSGASPDGAETVTARGKTLTSLFADAAVRQGRQMFLGNVRLIVFGSSLAVSGLDDTLQFLNGYHQLSPATQTALALGDAAELLEGDQAAGFSAGGLLETLSSAQKSGMEPECRLMDLSPAGQRDQAIPVLLRTEKEAQAPEPEASAPEESGGGESGDAGKKAGAKPAFEAVPAGAAILSGGRAVSYLTPEMARGLCWIQGNIPSAVLETERPLSAAVTHGISGRITPEAAADNIVFSVHLEIQSTLLEAPGDTAGYPGIARAQERIVADEVERFLAASCRQGYDPLDLTALLRRKMPRVLRDTDARGLLREAGYAVTVSCSVDQKGAASPQG